MRTINRHRSTGSRFAGWPAAAQIQAMNGGISIACELRGRVVVHMRHAAPTKCHRVLLLLQLRLMLLFLALPGRSDPGHTAQPTHAYMHACSTHCVLLLPVRAVLCCPAVIRHPSPFPPSTCRPTWTACVSKDTASLPCAESFQHRRMRLTRLLMLVGLGDGGVRPRCVRWGL